MRKSMWVLAAVATGALALAAAGCGGGGGSNSSAPPTTTTTTESTTTSTTTSTQSTTTQSTNSVSNFVASGKCRDLANKAQQLASAAQGAKGNLQDVANVLHQFANEVPSEIKGDVNTLADAVGSYADALKSAGYTPGKVPTAAQLAKIQLAVKDIQTTKVTQAEQHLSAWVKKNCS